MEDPASSWAARTVSTPSPARAAATVRDDLSARPGFARLQGCDNLHGDDLERFLLRTSYAFGDLIPQDGAGTLIRRVENRGTRIGEGRTTRYANSRFGGSLHTDGAERPFPVPKYFSLLCVRQSILGGELVVVHIDGVVSCLDPEMVDLLRLPFQFDRRGDQRSGESPTACKPIVFRAKERDRITYLREYVDAGHRHSCPPDLDEPRTHALDKLDAALDRPELRTTFKMRPGELRS
jgi:hypothetical protein